MPPRRHVTPKMIAANRANALRSSGPRTPAGKSRSRANSYVHGLRAEALAPPLLASDEARAAFAAHRLSQQSDSLQGAAPTPADTRVLAAAFLEALRDEFAPASPLEEALLRSLADACFGLRRALLAEADGIAAASRAPQGTVSPQGTDPAQVRIGFLQAPAARCCAPGVEPPALPGRATMPAAPQLSHQPASTQGNGPTAMDIRVGLAVVRYEAAHYRRFWQALSTLLALRAQRRQMAGVEAVVTARLHAQPQPISRLLCHFAPFVPQRKSGRANPIFTHLYASRPPPASGLTTPAGCRPPF